MHLHGPLGARDGRPKRPIKSNDDREAATSNIRRKGVMSESRFIPLPSLDCRTACR